MKDHISRLKEENKELRQDLSAYKKRRLSQQTDYEEEKHNDKKQKVLHPL